MSGLLGSTPRTEPERKEPSVITFDDAREESVFDALSTGTARAILAELHRAPAVPSELADSVGSSLQNVSYHLDKLEGADLVEVVDQCYSERGREMDVYEPTAGPLVLLPDDAAAGATLPTTDRTHGEDAGD